MSFNQPDALWVTTTDIQLTLCGGMRSVLSDGACVCVCERGAQSNTKH